MTTKNLMNEFRDDLEVEEEETPETTENPETTDSEEESSLEEELEESDESEESEESEEDEESEEEEESESEESDETEKPQGKKPATSQKSEPDPEPEPEPDIYDRDPSTLTREESQKIFAPAAISDEDIEPILEGGSKAVKAMQGIVNKAVTNAVRISHYTTVREVRAAMKEVNPVLQSVQQEAQQRAVSRLYEVYPDLKGKEKAVALVAQQIRSNSDAVKGKTFDQLAADIRKEVYAVTGGKPGKAKKPSAQTKSGKKGQQTLQPGRGRGPSSPPGSSGNTNNTLKSLFS